MPPLEWDILIGSFAQGVYNITKHGYEEMGHDHITVQFLEDALGRDAPELIEDYPNDYRGSCCLILAWSQGAVPVHAVVGYNGDLPELITVYSPPDLTIWESDFRTRR